ncbi:hypothetical protein Tco_0436772 [Tanacetum coccineum]
MDDPNITMEEYIRLEEDKAQKCGKVFNWETARILFDDSDNEDYTVVFDKNLFSYKIISTNDLKTDLENDNEKVMPSLPSPEPTISCFDDLDFFNDFENEFPAIVYNDSQTFKSNLLTESILSPQHIDEFDLNDETSLSECDEEEQNVLCFNDLYPFNVIYPDDSKSDKDNDDDKIDIKHSSGGFQGFMLALDHNLTYSPLQSTLNDSSLKPIGTCHKIWCFSYGLIIMDTLWNPSIKRSINILVPNFTSQLESDKILLGFGVRPDTLDPTIINISYPRSGQGTSYVSMFTLSSFSWHKLDNNCLPRESIRFKQSSQAVVGRLVLWAGHERFETDYYLFCGWSLSVDGGSITSFTLPFAIPLPHFLKLLGFTNNQLPLPIVEVIDGLQLAHSVQMYNRLTESFDNVGIKGLVGSFYIEPYKESLILLPYPDSKVYYMLEVMAIVVVCDGENGGDMVVSGRLKGCLDHWIRRSSPLFPPIQRL